VPATVSLEFAPSLLSLSLLDLAQILFFNLCYTSGFSCATLFSGMISIATKRITTPTSMSITSTKAKKTIFASGAWRNS
jgi:hypothetical protein